MIKLPHRLSITGDAVIETDGRIPGRYIAPIDIVPRRVQELYREVNDRLSAVARGFVKTLRWIQRASSPQSPFGFVGFSYSLDRSRWHAMPSAISALIEQGQGMNITSNAISEVSKEFAKGNVEPLGHELIREAFDISHQAPRSSLMIGVSALETGLKNYVQFRVPNSDILLEKIQQSPSAFTMVQEVIPALHKVLKLESAEFPLTSKLADYLRTRVLKRNKVTHGSLQSVNIPELLEFVNFVRTLLYKLDVCRGHDWAKAFTSTNDHD